jgi:hypothetical protein
MVLIVEWWELITLLILNDGKSHGVVSRGFGDVLRPSLQRGSVLFRRMRGCSQWTTQEEMERQWEESDRFAIEERTCRKESKQQWHEPTHYLHVQARSDLWTEKKSLLWNVWRTNTFVFSAGCLYQPQRWRVNQTMSIA